VKTNEARQPEIQLIMRLPKGYSPETPNVNGVLAFCTWEQKVENLRSRLLNDADPLVDYANHRGLALLTWNTETLWSTGKSFDDLTREERRTQDATFDAVARAWESGVKAICREKWSGSRGKS